MNPVPILPMRLDWPSAIGSYLLSFGSLEYFVLVYLKDHLPEMEFEPVKKWHFADRLKRISQYLGAERRAQAEQDAFAALVARVTPLRELRNLIAHGQMHVRPDSVPGKFKVVLLKSKDVDQADEPDTRELEFAELERSLTELTHVNREFERFAGFQENENETT